MMNHLKNGHVYILSNPSYKKALKVGRTSDLPETRAKILSKHAGVMEDFKVEWSKRVPNTLLAEYMLHYVLSPYSYRKEYFKIPLEDAKKICEEAINRLFKPLKSNLGQRFKEWEKEAKKLEKELNTFDPTAANREKETGISIIPVGEKNTTWETVAASLTYAFGSRVIGSCLIEGRPGDPMRKRFVSFRSNFKDMKRIDLYLYKKHLLVYVKTEKATANKAMLHKAFKSNFSQLDIANWEQGFSFKISTPAQYKILVSFLGMGDIDFVY